jgi:transposase
MIIEQLDDLPLLGKIIKDLRLPLLYEQHFPDHGHWEGVSGGQLLFGWLLYILSEGDHRLSHVEDWAALRLNTLAAVMGSPGLRRLDFSDDRLGRILDKLANDEAWEAFEQSIGRHIIQVYQPVGTNQGGTLLHVVRADTFNVPQFRDPGELFRRGYSKQRRDDLPFCKVMVGYLDELSLPLSVEVVKGSGPDHEYYLPTINKIRDMLGSSGNLYVGDSALGTTPNRVAIHTAGNYYLCPLSRKQVTQRQLDDYLDRLPPGSVEDLPGLFTEPGESRSPVYFFELLEQVPGLQPGAGWEERRLLVYSPQYTEGLLKSFYNRLDEAEEKIKNLVVGKKGRRNPTTLE